MAEVKSTVIQDKIEDLQGKGWKVVPDTECSKELIPLEPGAIRKFSGEWRIIIGKGAVYDTAGKEEEGKSKCGLYGTSIEVGYGARINGSITSRGNVFLETGLAGDKIGLVNGSITALKDVEIAEPKAKMNDWEEGRIMINGDIFADNIKIKSKATIRGSLIAKNNIKIEAETTVFGGIFSKKGTITVMNTTSYFIVGGNEGEGRIKTNYGVEVGFGVSVLNPLIWSRNGKINLMKDARYISSKCKKCADLRDYDWLNCIKFKTGECNTYEKITKMDLLPFKEGEIANLSWRTFKEDKKEYDIIYSQLIETMKARKRTISFEKYRYAGISTIEDLTPTITHITQIDQSVHTINIDQSTTIKDSVLFKSQIGTKGEEPIKTTSPTNINQSATISDSVVLKSKIGKEEEEETWYDKGLKLYDIGNYNGAIDCFDKALEINSNDADAWNGKGKVLGNLGRHEEAINCFDKALEINPKYEKAWYNKGFALVNLGNYNEAINYYDKALEINPKLAEAWNNKGIALSKLERHESAIYCFNKVLEFNPNNEEAWALKGIAFYILGKKYQAIECLEHALRIDPYDETARKALQMVRGY